MSSNVGTAAENKKNAALKNTVTAKDLGIVAATEQLVSQELFSLEIRRLLQNWRQGTVGCKARSDVSLSGRKPWKQKGTGRARAGAASSPIWRGGGVTFGPQARVKTLKTTKKIRKRVSKALFYSALNDGLISALQWNLSGDVPSTKQAFTALKNAGLAGEKVTLFLNPYDSLVAASFANIPFVRIVFFDAANAYDLANTEQWLILEKDTASFKEMVARWI